MRVLALLLLCACGPSTAAEWGADLFEDPGFSDSKFNVVACSTCHVSEPEPKSHVVHIGHPLVNTAFRPSWWGGQAPRLIDAVNFCYVYFMRGKAFDRDDVKGRALYEFLVSISPDRDAPALSLTIVENVRMVPRGNPERGETVYGRACLECHGDPEDGDGAIADDVPVLPNEAEDFARANGFDPALVVIEKVRHGQFFGIGGNMPLFAEETLSDADLGALLAYLKL